MNVKKLVARMSVKEKVAQLCSLESNEIMENGKLSLVKMRKRLKHGIGFIASLAGDLPPDASAVVINEMQQYGRNGGLGRSRACCYSSLVSWM
jgi:hypothetical protein